MVIGFEIAKITLDLIETATPRVVTMQVKRFLRSFGERLANRVQIGAIFVFCTDGLIRLVGVVSSGLHSC